MKRELFTFGILAYNNYEFIKEAVDSVLQQKYPRIELIISNDGSSDFDAGELEEYINKNKRDNIETLLIHNNEKNQGTVKNINYVCKHAHGKYAMFMAADDALYDSEVLLRFADEFENRDEEIKILLARVAMCGEELTDVKSYEPADERIELIKNGDNAKLFSVLTHESFIPTTSTCFKMEALESTDFYDEDYYIIEDASKFIKLAREGYKFGWVEDFVAARHRDGGISHGNARNKSESYRRYRFDEIVLYVKEILPYKDRIYNDDIKLMERKWNYVEGAYYKTFLLQEDGILDYRSYDREICEPRVKEFSKRYAKEKVKEWFKGKACSVSLKKVFRDILLLLIIALMVGFLDKFVSDYNIKVMNMAWISQMCMAGIYISLCILLLERCIAVLLRVAWEIYRIRRRVKS